MRAEFEYFYRTTTYNDRTGARVGDEVSLGKIDQEIETVEGGLDDVLSHNFFGNLYYDFTSKSRFTPYVGIGMGVTQASMDYSSRWKRNDNPDFITTFMDPALNTKTCRYDHHRHGQAVRSGARLSGAGRRGL